MLIFRTYRPVYFQLCDAVIVFDYALLSIIRYYSSARVYIVFYLTRFKLHWNLYLGVHYKRFIISILAFTVHGGCCSVVILAATC
jgi:hypothetical protein